MGKKRFAAKMDFTDTKANYIAQSNAAAHAEGLRVNMWYSLTGWRGSGLVDEELEPLPAYQAYQFSATQLENAVALRAGTRVRRNSGLSIPEGE